MRQDLLFAFRALRKSPWITATALLTLGLGIGALGAMFSVVNGVLLAPFPYAQPEQIVMVWNRWTDFPKTWVSIPEWQLYRQEAKSFQDVALFWTDGANLGGSGEPERVNAGLVTANFISVLGVKPLVGRSFTWEDGKPGRGNVVILSYGLWRRRFGGEPVVGTKILVDNTPMSVVGVMPAGFRLPLDFNSETPSELWIPLEAEPGGAVTVPANGGDHSFFAVGRLRPGRSAEGATAELRTIGRRLTAEGIYPTSWNFEAMAIPLLDEVLGTVRSALIVLLAAVVFVLLIACTNIANLLLARSSQRRREMAVRAALGASRGRLIRQLLTESIVLAVLGGCLGLVLASLGVGALRTINPADIPRITQVSLDGGVVTAVMLVALLTSVLFGLAPALQNSSAALQPDLKEGGRSGSLGSGQKRFRGLLVTAEMALAVVLVIASGLMIRSFSSLLQIDVGFGGENVLTMRLNPSSVTHADGEKAPRFYEGLLNRVKELSGVEDAAAVRQLPLASRMGDWGIEIEAYQPASGERVKGEWQAVTPGYFEVMGIPLKTGRYFTTADRVDSQPVIIVNEVMAKKFWPNENPIGKRVRVLGADDAPWSSVVGVVSDVRHNGVTAEVKEQWYLPHAQFHRSTGFTVSAMSLVVKTSVPPAQMVQPLRNAVLAYDPQLPVSEIQTLDEVLGASFSRPRFTMLLLVLFSALALTLAVVGVFGVMGYSISLRRQEIGLRMALGAQSRQVLGMILRQGVALSGIGIVVGVVAALVLTRFLSSLLYGVEAQDPLTFSLVVGFLFFIALCASYIPARRAAAIDPIIALRSN